MWEYNTALLPTWWNVEKEFPGMTEENWCTEI